MSSELQVRADKLAVQTSHEQQVGSSSSSRIRIHAPTLYKKPDYESTGTIPTAANDTIGIV
jgi:type IV secretory pathway ATPase VirB11/archaellum biosynthesis ATPase